MSSVREKIIELLGAGVSQTLVAQATGVTDGYISQLLELEEVREAVAAKKAGKLQQHIETDDNVESAERDALRIVSKRLASGTVPFKEALTAFSVLNAARKKADAGGIGNGAGAVDTIIFVLPKAAKTMIQISSDNQIVEVNGRTTAPLPSKALPTMALELAAAKRTVELPHVTDIKEKGENRDIKRAHAVLADITTVIDGVQVVI